MPKETRADRMLAAVRTFAEEEAVEAGIRRKYGDYRMAENYEARASAAHAIILRMSKVR